MLSKEVGRISRGRGQRRKCHQVKFCHITAVYAPRPARAATADNLVIWSLSSESVTLSM